MRPETLHKLVLVGILAGIGLSIWAGAETVYSGLQSSCSINPFFSCGAVDRSHYNTILGVPDWAIGLLGFIAMLIVDIPLYRTWKRSYLTVLLVLSGLGAAVSVYFFVVEVVLIGAICPVCLSAYFANGLVLGSTLALWVKGRGLPKADEPSASAPAEGAEPSHA